MAWSELKFPIDFSWKNCVSMLARFFIIKSSSNVLITRTCTETDVIPRPSLIPDYFTG